MGANNIGIGWTAEHDETLRAAWAAGDTATKIAADMGGFDHCVDAGRNSVISRVHRLGLSKRQTGKPRLDPEERDRREMARYTNRNARRSDSREAERVAAGFEPRPERQAPAPEPIFDPKGRPFGELRDFSSQRPNQCRYIDIKDHGPNFLYCGSETLPGESYCGHCREICSPPAITPRRLTEEQRVQRSDQGRAAGYASIRQRGFVMGRHLAAATSPVVDAEAHV